MDDVLTENRRVKLDVGDYTAEYSNGERCPIYFERKGLGDLFGTMGKGYARFKREMELAKKLNVRLILAIEGTSADVVEGFPHTSMSGLSILRKLQTLWLRYDLPHLFFPTRVAMAQYIAEFFKQFGYNYLRTQKKARHERA